MAGNALRTLALALLAVPIPCDAQVIVGRVTDQGGTPIPQARVMVRPSGETSDGLLRVAITNAAGEFRVVAATRGVMRVSVLRIGFRPDTGRLVDVSAGDASIVIALPQVALVLKPVAVVTGKPRCLPLEHPDQSAAVRDLVTQARDVLRARRGIIRDYESLVRLKTTYPGRPNAPGEETAGPLTVLDSLNEVREALVAARPIATIASRENDRRVMTWAMPQEATFLSPVFERRLCFDDVVYSRGSGNVEVRFLQRDARGNELAVAGDMAMTPDAIVQEINFRLTRQGRSYGEAKLAYAPETIGGVTFPLLRLHAQQMRFEPKFDDRVVVIDAPQRREIHYTYGPFVRKQ